MDISMHRVTTLRLANASTKQGWMSIIIGDGKREQEIELYTDDLRALINQLKEGVEEIQSYGSIE